MKKIVRLTLLLALVPQGLTAQTTFQKTYGTAGNEMGSCINQTTDNGYIISGIYADQGLYAIRTNAIGDTLWTKKMFGGLAAANAQTNDGGFILAGYMSDQVVGCNDFKLVKTDANGVTIWSHLYFATMDAMNISIIQTADNGYLVAGTTDSIESSPSQNYDFKIVKVDANGLYEWSKTYGSTASSDDEKINSVIQTSDLGYLLVGEKNDDVYLIKTDASGSTLWSNTYGGASTDQGNSIRQTADGGFIIAGGTMSFGEGFSDFYLIKTDVNGTETWSKTYGEANSEVCNAVRQATDGGYLLAGVTAGSASTEDVLLLKTDANGNLLWSKTYGGTGQDRGLGLDATQDGGAVVTGYTTSFGAGAYDFYVIKTDVDGNSNCNETAASSITGTPATITTSVVTPERNWGGPGNEPGFDFPVANPGVQTNTSCQIVSLSEMNLPEQSLSVFPNPVVGTFQLFSNNPEAENVMVYDLLGKYLGQYKLNSAFIVLHSGTYMLQVLNHKNEVLSIEKLIVE